MRRIIKQFLAAALYYSGLLALLDYVALTLSAKPHVMLLMYHRVLDDPFSECEYAQTGTAVSTKAFEAQIAFLAKRFTVLTASEYIERCRSGQSLPKKCAVITFDDGWADNFENAYPILKQHKVPATIFVCTDFVDTTKKFWFHEMLHTIKWQKLSAEQLVLALKRVCPETPGESFESILLSADHSPDVLIGRFFRLAKTLSAEQLEILLSDLRRIGGKTDEVWNQQRFILTWKEVAAMDQEIIEIGSHGKSHKLLTSVSSNESERELIESKSQIEQKLGRKVRTFAYPNGSYSETIKKMVSEAGYTGAFGVGFDNAESDLFAVSRAGVHEGAATGFRGGFSRAIWALTLSPTRKVWLERRKSSHGTGRDQIKRHDAMGVH